MEKRVITLILESRNRTKTINTDATTLGELKRALDDAGIPYEGMSFREGLSRTEMTDDGSLLPKDVLYRGAVTNNLVFTLTTAGKHIKSGAYTRADAFAAVKKMGLQQAVKDQFGRNFTQVPTDDLMAFVQAAQAKPCQSEQTPSNEGLLLELVKRVDALEKKVESLTKDSVDESSTEDEGELQSPWSEEDLAHLRM